MNKYFLCLAIAIISAVLSCVPSDAADPIKIGMAWIGKSESSTRYATILAEDWRQKAAPIELEVQGELPEEQFPVVIARFQQEKAGMIIVRSNSVKWLENNPPSIPTFVGGINHPVYLGLVKDMNAPEGNITGVSYFVPVKTQFEIFQAIIPNLKSVWLLLQKDHPSSIVDQEQTQKYCAEFGIEYHESLSSTSEEVLAAVQQAVQQGVSAIILGNQAVAIDNAEAIVSAAGSVPTLSYLSPPVKQGVLGGFNADETALIHMLADSVIDVLVNGKAIKDVPFKFDPNPQFSINETAAQRLQLTIPYEILQHATIVK